MRRAVRAILLGSAVSGLMAAMTTGVFADAGGAAHVPLNNGQEAPKPVNGGASGEFSWTLDGTTFCWELTVSGLSTPAIAAHVHEAPRGVPGPVVIPLTVQSATEFTTDGCTEISSGLAADLISEPENYYVNVHTSTNQPGEIRGQLK